MWQRRSSQSEPPFSSTSPANPAYAYHSSPAYSSSQMSSRRGPVEAPPGHQLRRRVTWRSSAYKIIAYLYVLGILYIVWLIRDLFWLPFSPSPSASRQPKE